MLSAMGLHTIAGMQDMTTKQDGLMLWKASQIAIMLDSGRISPRPFEIKNYDLGKQPYHRISPLS